jgi:hypothetical protein
MTFMIVVWSGTSADLEKPGNEAGNGLAKWE